MKIFFTRKFTRHVGDIDMGSRLLDLVLREKCGLPADVSIHRGSHGKPFVDGSYGVHFSVTDTESMWMCSVADYVHGTDAEYYLRNVRDADKLASRFMTEAESRYVCSASTPEEQSAQFTYLWTRKEAYLKYSGEGLAGISSVPPVFTAPEGTDLRTFVYEGLYVSICAPENSLSDYPDFICIDRQEEEPI